MESTTPQRTKTNLSATALQHLRERRLSNIVHDLSNPLFAARGYLRLALEQRDPPLPDPLRRYLTTALENLNKLVSLTQELGTLREIDELECATVSIGDMIQRAIFELSARLSSKGVVLVDEIGNAPLSTFGDRRKLSEAVLELLSLAVEFTEPGGRLNVRASEENGKIAVEADAIPAFGEAAKDASARISSVCRIWRLHAGSCTFEPNPSGVYRIVCELPIVRPQEC